MTKSDVLNAGFEDQDFVVDKDKDFELDSNGEGYVTIDKNYYFIKSAPRHIINPLFNKMKKK